MAYEEYQKLFEQLIINIMTECDVSNIDIFQVLQNEKEDDPMYEEFVDVFLSIADKDRFIILMENYQVEEDESVEEVEEIKQIEGNS